MFEQLLVGSGDIVKRIAGKVAVINSNYGVSTSGSFATVLGDFLYTGGGRQTSGVALNTFRRFNLLTREWTTLANLPVVNAGAILTGWSGKIYMFGGTTTNSSTYIATLYEYDVAANTWKTLATPTTGARVWHSGALVNGKIYYFGGYSGSQRNGCDVYDIATNTWAPIANLPATRHGHTCVAVGNMIYLFGGLTNQGGTTNNDIIAYSIADNTFTTLPASTNRPAVRCYTGMVAGYDRLYVYGGYTDGNGTASRSDMWEFNYFNNTWKLINFTGDELLSRAGYSFGFWQGEFHILNGRGTASSGLRTDHSIVT